MIAAATANGARIGIASVMLANNETGAIQPVRALAELAQSAGIPLHTDAAQVVGKLDVNFRSLGVTALSCAAHKFHGPRGIGALLLKGGAKIEPTLWGGFHQQGLRAGTECVALAVGMHTAAQRFSSASAKAAASSSRDCATDSRRGSAPLGPSWSSMAPMSRVCPEPRTFPSRASIDKPW